MMSEMKHLVSFLFASLLFTTLTFVSVQVFSYQSQPIAPITSPSAFRVSATSGPTISASAYIIFDVETGLVLAERDSGTPYPIASVTKLFTAAAILESFNPEATTTITWRDVAGEGESGNLKTQQVYTYRELLFPLLLTSSNDAADALWRATDGVLLSVMQSVASSSGAKTTQLVDASGLSAKNVASANDLRLFARAVGEKYPFVFDVSRLPQYIGEYTGWRNNSPVADDSGYQGGKHGYTPAAGRTLVGEFSESFTGGKRTIGYVILGSDNLAADTEVLRDFVATEVTYE